MKCYADASAREGLCHIWLGLVYKMAKTLSLSLVASRYLQRGRRVGTPSQFRIISPIAHSDEKDSILTHPVGRMRLHDDLIMT